MPLTISSLLPSLIIELDHNRERPWSEWVVGSVLFADVSGFTAISESLAVHGAEGAEMLTNILNRYFAAMISTIQGYGGQVMKFGGDAILCFFPGQQALVSTLAAAHEMQAAMTRFKNISTPVGNFMLAMKIGVASGEVLLGVVGKKSIRCDYIFAGQPVDLTAEAEHIASAGDILFAGEKITLYKKNVLFRQMNQSLFKIVSVPPTKKRVIQFPRIKKNLESFLISGISEMVHKGMERHIGALISAVPVFLRFSGFHYEKESFKLQRFHDFFKTITHHLLTYRGNLNRINMGDKGSTFFILFGSPDALENKEQLACLWALTLVKKLSESFPEISVAIGMNSGRIFSGLVGGAQRFDFTVMGDTVNYAARLMQRAQSNEILVSESVSEIAQNLFVLTKQGDFSFKGKEGLLPVYNLIRKKQMKLPKLENGNSQKLFGRKKEWQELNHLISNTSGLTNCLVFIGKPGIGKSHLLGNFCEQQKKDGWNVGYIQCDITMKYYPYTPWKHIFNQLLSDDRPTEKTISSMLNNIDSSLMYYLPRFCEFFGVPYSRIFIRDFDESDEKVFQQILGIILSQLFHQKKTIIVIDGLEYIDSLSCELFQNFLDTVDFQGSKIIIATRTDEITSKLASRVDTKIIEIHPLSEEALRSLVESELGDEVENKVITFLLERTDGNPLFIKTLINYFQEKNYLEKLIGKLTFKQNVQLHNLPQNDDIIISLIDTYSYEEKIHLRYVTCIGPTFLYDEIKIVMGIHFKPQVWKQLINRDIIIHHGNGRYCFKQFTVQDTIYHSIPSRLRKQIHAKIGTSFEKLYCHCIDDMLPKLANHFILAQQRDKTIKYGIFAADRLFRAFSIAESLRYLTTVYRLLKYTSNPMKWQVGLDLSDNLLLSDKIRESLSLSEEILRSVRRQDRKLVENKALVLKYMALARLGEYQKIYKQRKKLQTLKPLPKKESLQLQFVLGCTFESRGNFSTAILIFKKIASIAPKNNCDPMTLSSLTKLASLYKRLKNYQVAFQYCEKVEEQSTTLRFHYYSIRARLEKALIFSELCEFDKALVLYDSLSISCRKYGDYYTLSAVLLNKGSLLIDYGKFDQAEYILDEALKLASRIGSFPEIAAIFNYKGFIQFKKNNYQRAYGCYKKSLDYNQQIGNTVQSLEVLYNLAEVCLLLGKKTQAHQYTTSGLKICEAIGDITMTHTFQQLMTEGEKT